MIDKETVSKIAHLARLKFDSKTSEKMTRDLNQILEWVEKLNEIDTRGIEPLTGMSEEMNVMREDVAKDTLSHEDALKNAPKKDSNYFRVPKVMGSN
jgi:aspartyl-tRNA(Asn)/glutamyl-tRNA(Gln) amidotransferase subunit C